MWQIVKTRPAWWWIRYKGTKYRSNSTVTEIGSLGVLENVDRIMIAAASLQEEMVFQILTWQFIFGMPFKGNIKKMNA